MKIGPQTAREFHCPRWHELPAIPLYMDQVMLVLKDTLGVFGEFYDDKERTITPAMINNYVKQKLVSPPVSKKYERGHIAFFIILTIFKKVLSINEIASLIEMLSKNTSIENAYDLFCEDFEAAFSAAYAPNAPSLALTTTKGKPRMALSFALAALMGKLLLQNNLSEVDEEAYNATEAKPAAKSKKSDARAKADEAKQEK